MILQNLRSKDAEDVGVLFHAIILFAEANADRLDRSLVAAGYGELLKLANQAAEVVALLHEDEGEAWDGVVWYERLVDAGEQSLAAALFTEDHPDVSAIVTKWLLSFGNVEIVYGGKRWSFDDDQLAEWDETAEEFHFSCYHGLTNPTAVSVSQFLENRTR